MKAVKYVLVVSTLAFSVFAGAFECQHKNNSDKHTNAKLGLTNAPQVVAAPKSAQSTGADSVKQN